MKNVDENAEKRYSTRVSYVLVYDMIIVNKYIRHIMY